jgi:hypothetical protein
MKTQNSNFANSYGIDVRDMVRVTNALSVIFTSLSDEERVAYATLKLCTAYGPELIRYDEDLCAICVGPVQLDIYGEQDQSAKFFLQLITDPSELFCTFRESVNNQLNMRDAIQQIRERMLIVAKDVLESYAVEGFC